MHDDVAKKLLLKGWRAKKTQSIKHPSLLGKGRGV
jgi:hypothetical protein